MRAERFLRVLVLATLPFATSCDYGKSPPNETPIRYSPQDRLSFAEARYAVTPDNSTTFPEGIILNFGYPELGLQLASQTDLQQAKTALYGGASVDLIHTTIFAPVLESERAAVEAATGTNFNLAGQFLARYNTTQKLPQGKTYDVVVRVVPVLQVLEDTYKTKAAFKANRPADKAAFERNLAVEWLRTLSLKGSPRFSQQAVSGIASRTHLVTVTHIDPKLAELANLR